MHNEDLELNNTMVDMPYYPTQLNHIYLINMYKEGLGLNNL